MSNNIEIEAKALLSKEDYEKLIGVFGDAYAYYQTNIYIDSPKRILHENKLSLRIREKDGKHEMTLKTKLEEGRLERNVYISNDQFEDFKKGIFPEGEIKKAITDKGIDLSSLGIIGSLTTKRVDAPYMGGFLSIDMNTYNNKVDYEVELEHTSMEEAISRLKGLLEENGIEFKENHETKTSRALKATL